jgi:predicted GIY-YIG superfamily endonuclease
MIQRRLGIASMCAKTVVLSCVETREESRIEAWKRKAKHAAKAKKGRNLYIITLHPDVLERRDFREANPNYIEGMPCVYVGITIHNPGDRYEQHKTGYKSSKYPRRYGIELALELMEGFDDSGLTDEEKEPALADWLRDQGFAVWQN